MARNANLNYASAYTTELQAMYPYVLYFGDLYSAPDNSKYRFLNEKTIEMPSVTTSGRTDSDRSGDYTQGSYGNNWITRTLENERQWNIKIHPRDVEETNGVSALDNLIKDHNEQHKFPEMDCYTASKIWYEWNTTNSKVPVTTALTTDNILDIIDNMMEDMDEARVPSTGRILYCTNATKTLIKNAQKITRMLDVKTNGDAVNRDVNRLDELVIKTVPKLLMKTKYDFTVGAVPASDAKQINMMIIHPTAVITPNTYAFAQYDAPSAGSKGLGEYFEESHEDVFLMPFKEVAVAFHTEPLA